MNEQVGSKLALVGRGEKHVLVYCEELFCIDSVISNLETWRLDPITSKSDNPKGML